MTTPRMRYCLLAAVAAAALLPALTGCDALPEGEPPPGDLVSNTPPPVVTPLAIRNHLATQLIVFALQRGVTGIDPGSDPEAQLIAVEAARTAGFRLDRSAPLRLALVRDPSGAIDLTATDANGVEVWRSQRP